MADTQNKANPQAQAGQANGENKQRKPRTTPEFVGIVDEVPASKKDTFWGPVVDNLKTKPGVTHKFKVGSSTTASTLKSNYGVDAVTRTESGQLYMYLTYNPQNVEANMAGQNNRKSPSKASK